MKIFDPCSKEVAEDKLSQPLVLKVSEGKIGADGNYEGLGKGRNPSFTVSLNIFLSHLIFIFFCSYTNATIFVKTIDSV